MNEMLQPDELSLQLQEALSPLQDFQAIEQASLALANWMCSERQKTLDALSAESETVRLAISPESSRLLDAFDDCMGWLNLAADHQRTHSQEKIQAAARHWPDCWKLLQFCRLDHSEALWSLAGPSWHPGINRLLQLEENDALIQAEIERCQAWLQQSNHSNSASAHQLAWVEFQQRYLASLSEPLNDELLEQLGELHDSLDYDGLWRRYSGGPTSRAWLNLIIHGGWLWSQRKLHPSMLERLEAHSKESLLDDPQAEQLADWLEDYLDLLHSFDEQEYRALVDEVLELEKAASRP